MTRTAKDFSLKTRRREPELMDQPGLDAESHRHALSGLARVNWWSRSDAIFWPELDRLAQEIRGRSVRVLDLACGGGDVTVALARRAKQRALPIEFCGVDFSETALDVARERALQANVSIDFRRLDVLSEPLPAGFDAVMCSLFLHHLDDSEATQLLKKMADVAQHVVLVNDLVRSPMGYWMAVWGTKLLTRSRIVHVDGPLSVAAAFTTEEVYEMAQVAGLHGIRIERHWPWRFLMKWRRQ